MYSSVFIRQTMLILSELCYAP